MMHGGTSNQDRERIVKNWKLGKLDLVIGTSAFGLGINYLQQDQLFMHVYQRV